MPKLSLFNTIFREPWMLEPQTAAANRQVLDGLMMGLEFAPESDEVQASIDHRHSSAIPRGRKVNLLNLEGTMLRDDAGCGLVGTRTLASLLREADADKAVVGHILRIDSGGGAANSVPDLAEAIQSCQKPVVAFVDGFMCSAAMYAGSYCKHIMANRDDNRIGCIGTMIQIADFPKKATDPEGRLHLRIYADGSEDKNGEFESALEGDFSLIKNRVLNPTNEKFKADIRNNRPATTDDQLTGRTYMAKEVLGTLIDSIGNFDAAVAKVVELSNINIQKMEGLEHLQAVPGCANLEMVGGTVDLNQEQLDNVDAAIATEKALVQTKDKTIADQTAEIARLKEENASSKTTIESQKTEIAGLKGTIEELNKKPTPPAQGAHNGDPVATEGDNDNPEEFCENLMKKIYG